MAGQALDPSQAPSWYQFVTNFDAVYRQFYMNYDALMALGPYLQSTHSEMLQEYNGVLQDASNYAYKLEQLKATRDYVYSWLQWLQSGIGDVGSFLSSSAQAAYDYAKSALGFSGTGANMLSGFDALSCNCNPTANPPRGLQGLGIAPVIWVAIGVVAALSQLTNIQNWITSVLYPYSQKLNFIQDQEARNVPPLQASQIADSVYGKAPNTTTDFLGIPWSLIAWAAIAIFLGPPIIDAITVQQQRREWR